MSLDRKEFLKASIYWKTRARLDIAKFVRRLKHKAKFDYENLTELEYKILDNYESYGRSLEFWFYNLPEEQS